MNSSSGEIPLFKEEEMMPKMESTDAEDEWPFSLGPSSNPDFSAFPWTSSLIPFPSSAPEKKTRKPRAQSTKNRSPFLRFFIECSDPSKLRCVLCPTVPPTEIRYMYGTKKVSSSLRDHLLAAHPTDLSELLEGEARHDQASRHLLRAVASGVLPLSSVDDPEIRGFVRCLDPLFALPDSQSLTRGVLEAEYSTVHAAVKKEVEGEDVALTVEEWSGGESKMMVTAAHFIDKEWNRMILVVDIVEAEGGHKAPHSLSENTLGFRSVIASITDSNEAVNNIKDRPSLPCVLRACDRLVSDSLAAFTQGINLIERIRTVAVHLHTSMTSWEELKRKLAASKCKERGKIPLYGRERWEGTMRMMRVADAQMSYLDDSFLRAGVPLLSNDERLLLSRLVAFLEEVDDFAAKMSTHHSTLSSLIPYIRGLEVSVTELADGPLHAFHPFVFTQFTQRFAMYREESVARKAYLLDPRFLHLGMLDEATRTADLEEIFKEADEECKTNAKGGAEPPQKKSRSNLLSKAAPQSSVTPISHAKREYDLLLDLAHSRDLPEDSDPCSFWRENEGKMPRLAPIAKRLITIPPSTINAHRILSIMEQNQGEMDRSKVAPGTVKKLLFIGAYCKKEELRFKTAEEYEAFFTELKEHD